MADIEVRELGRSDMESLMPMMIQLGYELNVDELLGRFDAISASRDHAILGADRGGLLAGFCHVFSRPALEKPVEAVVQALVVDTQERKSGIGRALMAAAEDWARARGLASVSLYSQEQRKDAHAFYESLGYEAVATSTLLRKWFVRVAV